MANPFRPDAPYIEQEIRMARHAVARSLASLRAHVNDEDEGLVLGKVPDVTVLMRDMESIVASVTRLSVANGLRDYLASNATD